MMSRLAGATLAAAFLLFSALHAAGTRAPGPLAGVEDALELHLRGLEAHASGEPARAARLLEEACLLGHEPSCQAVWLQVDIGSGDAAERERLEGAARRLADATDGTWFPRAGEEGSWVRVYCPVEREAELRGALERLRIPLGG